jgi:hypothetical protein
MPGELRFDSVEFDSFTNFGVVDGGGTQTQLQPKTMFTLFRVKCTNINFTFGLFNSGFESLYGETLSFVNCSCCGLFEITSISDEHTPVFRDLITNSVTQIGSEGLIFSLNDCLRFFVIEEGIFTNTDNFYSRNVTIYIESVQFIQLEDTERVGIHTKGTLSIKKCEFQGFKEGISGEGSVGELLICNSNFINCSTGIYCTIEQNDVLNCVFSGYDKCGIKCVIEGEEEENKTLRVHNCAFLESDVVGIQGQGISMYVNESCFKRNGEVIVLTNSKNFQLGEGCCFRAAEEVAIKLPSGVSIWKRYSGSPFLCTEDCLPQHSPSVTSRRSTPGRPLPATGDTGVSDQLSGDLGMINVVAISGVLAGVVVAVLLLLLFLAKKKKRFEETEEFQCNTERYLNDAENAVEHNPEEFDDSLFIRNSD